MDLRVHLISESDTILEEVVESLGSQINILNYFSLNCFNHNSMVSGDILIVDTATTQLFKFLNFYSTHLYDKEFTIFLICSDSEVKTILEVCMDKGFEYLTKPIDKNVLKYRFNIHKRYLSNIGINRVRELEFDLESERLKSKLEIDNREMELEIVNRLVRAGDMRRPEFENRRIRVSFYSMIIASDLFKDDPEIVDRIFFASSLLDIGEVAVPESVLNVSSRLELVANEQYKHHVEVGYRILEGSLSETLRLAASICLNHHEHVDGSGYPEGLSGSEIPVEARVVAVADRFDDYTQINGFEKGVENLKSLSGNVLDDEYVQLLLGNLDQIKKIYDLY